MAGAHPADPLSWPVPLGDEVPLDWTRLRVAVSADLGWAPVDPEVRTAFLAAVDRLADDGARVVEAHPDAGPPTQLWNDIALPEGFASEGPLLDARPASTRPRARSRSPAVRPRHGTISTPRTGEEPSPGPGRPSSTQYDVLLAPSMPVPAFSTDVTGPTEIDGTPVDPFFDDWCALALPANLTGQPATAVPTGLSADGLPVGLQVMGPRWADLRTLAVAARLESLTGFELRPARADGPGA